MRWIWLWFNPEQLREVGATPDYRFSLANERTFLAWIRTALALVGGGIAVAQFVTVPHLRKSVAVALMVLGTVCAMHSVGQWIRNEAAMRRDRDLPGSRVPASLAVSVALGTMVLIAIIAFGSLA